MDAGCSSAKSGGGLMPLVISYPSDHQHLRSGACASSGDTGGKVVGRISRRVFDPYKARREFPDRWAAWCRAHFRDSVMLAHAFGVSEKTARLWMEGVTAPQGWAVDAAKDGCVADVPPFGSEAA